MPNLAKEWSQWGALRFVVMGARNPRTEQTVAASSRGAP